MTAIAAVQKRFIEMIDAGLTHFHLDVGPAWHDMSIEQKCEVLMDVWNKGLTLKPDNPPRCKKPAVNIWDLVDLL